MVLSLFGASVQNRVSHSSYSTLSGLLKPPRLETRLVSGRHKRATESAPTPSSLFVNLGGTNLVSLDMCTLF